MSCNAGEQTIVKHLRFTPIWTNIIYLIAPCILFFYKEWMLGTIILAVALISIAHHVFSYVQAQCTVKKTKRHRLLGWLDVTCANCAALIVLYTIYTRGIVDRKITVWLGVSIFSISMILFFLAYHYEMKSENLNKNSGEFIKLASLYELYHGYWHIFSGIGILICCYLLVKDRL